MALNISIQTVAELQAHEAEILAEINAQSNGGLMYFIDPLRMLRKVGVTLSPELTDKLVAKYPLLVRPAPQASAFEKLRTEQAKQRVHAVITALFEEFPE